ncbi:MAG: cupin domain-containing protein [Thermodesulfobacteriota bacterium]
MRLEVRPWDESGELAVDALRARLEREGYSVFCWTDPPAAHYDAHAHDHDESIWLVSGKITFGTASGALALEPGDRLMLPAGTVHTADAGSGGATYLIGERR